jgi:hypothetical protein
MLDKRSVPGTKALFRTSAPKEALSGPAAQGQMRLRTTLFQNPVAAVSISMFQKVQEVIRQWQQIPLN